MTSNKDPDNPFLSRTYGIVRMSGLDGYERYLNSGLQADFCAWFIPLPPPSEITGVIDIIGDWCATSKDAWKSAYEYAQAKLLERLEM
jgi:hypothetical protein